MLARSSIASVYSEDITFTGIEFRTLVKVAAPFIIVIIEPDLRYIPFLSFRVVCGVNLYLPFFRNLRANAKSFSIVRQHIAFYESRFPRTFCANKASAKYFAHLAASIGGFDYVVVIVFEAFSKQSN